MRMILTLLLLAVAFSTGHGQGTTTLPAGPDPLEITGALDVTWGDPAPGSGSAPELRFTLAADDGRPRDLVLTQEQREAAGGLVELVRSRVSVTGRPEPSRPDRLVVEQLTRLGPAGDKGETRGVYGSQPYIWILVRFADNTTTPEPVSWFETQALGPYPSVDSFWREASFNNINLVGSDVVGWLTLPHVRSYYVYDMDPADPGDEFNVARFLADVVPLANPLVYFPAFKGIHFCFNGDLDGYAWGGTAGITADGQTLTYGVTYLPPWGWQNQSVVVHEGGHSLGLPHSSGWYGEVYDSFWDTMSFSSGTGVLHDPVYGPLAEHVNAYGKDRLGWIHPLHTYTMPATPYVASVWLNDLVVVPPAGRYLQFKFPYPNNPANWLSAERRRFTGFDGNVAGESVVLHDVIVSRDVPSQVFDSDQDGDPNDEGAMWEPGEVLAILTGVPLVMTVEQKDATGTQITFCNAPRELVYVNQAHTISEDGSSAHPWNTVFEGSGAVYPGGTVYIYPATYGETITLRKAATYQRWGTAGVVTIGM